MTPDEIHNRFSYHPAKSDQRKREHDWVRDLHERIAMALAGNLPQGRELSLSITKLEESMYWANAALARVEDPNAGPELTPEQRAQRAYEKYGLVTGGKTFDGRDMPHWSQLGENIQAAWVAATSN